MRRQQFVPVIAVTERPALSLIQIDMGHDDALREFAKLRKILVLTFANPLRSTPIYERRASRLQYSAKTRVANHTKPWVKNEQREFENFTQLLDKLLSVPHSKIKAELEAEKKRRRRPRDRAIRGHAYCDED